MHKKHLIGERKKNYIIITENLNLIKLPEEASINKGGNLTGKDRHSIRSWIEKKNDFLNVNDKNTKLTLNKGRKPLTLEHEPNNRLCKWFK